MNKFKFNTRTSKAEAQLRSLDLVEVIKSPTLTSGVETQVDLDAVMPTDIDDPYPVVILINGTGGCGKGTLIKQIHQYTEAPVYELSTVDPIRPVAKDLIKCQQDWWMDLYAEDDRPMSAADEVDEKGGPYRQLLRDIKEAWSKHGDGPNAYAIGATIRLIEDRNWTVGEDGLPYRDPLSEFPMPAMIFVNVREPENLDALKEAYWELGLLCITLKMEGIEHEEKDLASSDLLVDDYAYDLVIRNKGTIDDLSVLAFTMSTFIRRANRMYGISVAESKIDPMEALGQKVLYVLSTEIDLASDDPDLDDPDLLVGVSSGSLTSVSSFEYMPLIDQLHALENRDKKALYIAAAKAVSSHGYELKEAGSTYTIVTLVPSYLAAYPNGYRALTPKELIDLTREIVRDVAFPRSAAFPSIPSTNVIHTNTSPKEGPFEPLPFRTNASNINGVWTANSGLENTNNT